MVPATLTIVTLAQEQAAAPAIPTALPSPFPATREQHSSVMILKTAAKGKQAQAAAPAVSATLPQTLPPAAAQQVEPSGTLNLATALPSQPQPQQEQGPQLQPPHWSIGENPLPRMSLKQAQQTVEGWGKYMCCLEPIFTKAVGTGTSGVRWGQACANEYFVTLYKQVTRHIWWIHEWAKTDRNELNTKRLPVKDLGSRYCFDSSAWYKLDELFENGVAIAVHKVVWPTRLAFSSFGKLLAKVQ